MESIWKEIFVFKRPRDYYLLFFGCLFMVINFFIFNDMDIDSNIRLRDQNIQNIQPSPTVGGNHFSFLRTRLVEIKDLTSYNNNFLNLRGYYDIDGIYEGLRGTIYLSPRLLPEDSFTYNMVYKHEYGHVFLEDYLNQSKKDNLSGYIEDLGAIYYSSLTQSSPMIAVAFAPKELRELFEFYKSVDPMIYDDDYYTSNFGEFIAESYSYYITRYDENRYIIYGMYESGESYDIEVIEFIPNIPLEVENFFMNLEDL